MLWMDRENPFQISNEHRMISATESELEKYPIVFMHGRGSFRFSESNAKLCAAFLRMVVSCLQIPFAPTKTSRPAFDARWI